ncbi:hypothetical protein [Vallitalea okinawensis]|uniref:hypothetical protein n=1 Tax=Vallitalea okinawensis TaxID=2078660 RepID=UPI000CFDCDE1|nr:hypothetical protein [Vallitalea okinawensis]
MEIVLVVIFFIIIVFVHFLQGENHQGRINEKVNSLGGNVISTERCNLLTGTGPFIMNGKGRTIYRVEYEINGISKEGWVRFGGITGPDWRL